MLLNHGTILTIGGYHSRIKLTLHIAIKLAIFKKTGQHRHQLTVFIQLSK